MDSDIADIVADERKGYAAFACDRARASGYYGTLNRPLPPGAVRLKNCKCMAGLGGGQFEGAAFLMRGFDLQEVVGRVGTHLIFVGRLWQVGQRRIKFAVAFFSTSDKAGSYLAPPFLRARM